MARTLASTLIVATTILCARSAAAHPEFNPVQVNRYLKFEVDDKGLTLIYTWLYGAAPAYPLRKLYDKNGDGVLDIAEQTQLGEALLDRTLAHFVAELDGKVVTPTAEKPAVGLSGADVSAEPLSVDLTFHIATDGGPHRLWIDDKNDVPGQGEVETRVEDPIDGAPMFLFRGHDPSAREKKFMFVGERRTALEDRSVTIEFQSRAAKNGRAMFAAAIGASIFALASFAFVWMRRRKIPSA